MVGLIFNASRGGGGGGEGPWSAPHRVFLLSDFQQRKMECCLVAKTKIY